MHRLDIYTEMILFILDNVSEKSGGSDDNSPFHENGKLISSATPYTTDAEILRTNHPLTIMVCSMNAFGI